VQGSACVGLDGIYLFYCLQLLSVEAGLAKQEVITGASLAIQGGGGEGGAVQSVQAGRKWEGIDLIKLCSSRHFAALYLPISVPQPSLLGTPRTIAEQGVGNTGGITRRWLRTGEKPSSEKIPLHLAGANDRYLGAVLGEAGRGTHECKRSSLFPLARALALRTPCPSGRRRGGAARRARSRGPQVASRSDAIAGAST